MNKNQAIEHAILEAVKSNNKNLIALCEELEIKDISVILPALKNLWLNRRIRGEYLDTLYRGTDTMIHFYFNSLLLWSDKFRSTTHVICMQET